nr:PQQ-binding-like beta-propeller repeat protein [Bacteroidales bacterium]
GDITATNVLWRKRDNQTQTQMLSPVIKGGLIYTINTRNEMQCIDAKSGAVVWQERQRSNFNSSPVWAGGNIWFGSVKGDVIAVRAGRVYEPLAQFTMESGIWATPAFLRNSVIVRTENFLYRFGR